MAHQKITPKFAYSATFRRFPFVLITRLYAYNNTVLIFWIDRSVQNILIDNAITFDIVLETVVEVIKFSLVCHF
jgi:hypothetical protein